MRTRFYWTQRFPAHRTLIIGHSYQPITGGGMPPEDVVESYGASRYCMDRWTRLAIDAKAAWRRLRQGWNQYSVLREYQTDYILETARTWHGPIGRFHLTVDKLKAGNILSLCWDGPLAKTGPTTYEFTAVNFTPARDIRMLVLE